MPPCRSIMIMVIFLSQGIMQRNSSKKLKMAQVVEVVISASCWGRPLRKTIVVLVRSWAAFCCDGLCVRLLCYHQYPLDSPWSEVLCGGLRWMDRPLIMYSARRKSKMFTHSLINWCTFLIMLIDRFRTCEVTGAWNPFSMKRNCITSHSVQICLNTV